MTSVTVSLLTFNHEKYIEECIDSVLRQRGDFDIDVVWYDDCSGDRTREIGIAMLEQSGINSTLVHPKNNRRSRRVPIHLERFEPCLGDYICLLEGDDFWQSDTKLETQIEALKQSNCDICFSSAEIVDAASVPVGEKIAEHDRNSTTYSPQQVVDGDGGFMPTPAVMFKGEVLQRIPPWYFAYCGGGADYALQVIGSYITGGVYIPETTAAYRRHSLQWSEEFERNPTPEKRVTFLFEFLTLLFEMSNEPKFSHLNFENIINNYFSQLMFGTAESEFVVEKQIASIKYAQFLDSKNKP